MLPASMEVSGLAGLSLPARVPWWMLLVGGQNVTLNLGLREAELLTLRGWLALEAGAIADARRDLREALSVASPGDREMEQARPQMRALTAILGTPTLRMSMARYFNFRGRALAQLGLDWLRSGEQ